MLARPSLPTLGRGASCLPGLVLRARLCLLTPEVELPDSQGWSAAGPRCLGGVRLRPRTVLACKQPGCVAR
jgi:hypothetical protein